MQRKVTEKWEEMISHYGTADPFKLIKAMGITLIVNSRLQGLKGFYTISNRSRYIVINGNLNERERLIVAAHELGHDRMHQYIAKDAPLRDFDLYNMKSQVEHQANVFAANLLIPDQQVLEGVANELDYFNLCKTLRFPPELVSFKLYSMLRRGYAVNLPESPDSRFLR